MIGFILGYVEAAEESSFDDTMAVGLAAGILLGALSLIGESLEIAGFLTGLATEVTLHGTLFGSPVSGTLLTAGLVLVYVVGDTIVGYGAYRVIDSVQEMLP